MAVSLQHPVRGSAAAPWSVRGMMHRLRTSPLLRLRFSLPVHDTLVVTPASLRRGDGKRARQIYEGIFEFDGERVVASGFSPFRQPAPSRHWQAALHGFSWLADLNDAGTPLLRANALICVKDWIASCGGSKSGVAWEPEVAAERVMAWLAHAGLVTKDADRAFGRVFLRTIADHVRYLELAIGEAPEGLPRLKVRLAITSALLCMGSHGTASRDRHLAEAAGALEAELDRQILADGGHVSRNPGDILQAMADLLPVYQLCCLQADARPEGLLAAIDRAMPMLMFFRHRDGSLAGFNGGRRRPHAAERGIAHQKKYWHRTRKCLAFRLSAPCSRANSDHHGYRCSA